MRKYLSFFRIRFLAGLQYRTAAYAGIVTQFAWGFMELLMFRAFYKADTAAFPMEFSQLSSYIWLQQAFLALYMTWFWENDISASITNGNVAYSLARPIGLYEMWFIQNVASRLSKAVLRCMPILVLAIFLPQPYGIRPPQNISVFGVFLFTMVLSFLTVVAFCMLIYITIFYTMSSQGVRIVSASVTEFLAGAVIPLPFLPQGLRRAIELTPFASMQNLPFRIYSGNIAGAELVRGVILQLFWLFVLVTVGRLWMNHSLKKVVVQGG